MKTKAIYLLIKNYKVIYVGSIADTYNRYANHKHHKGKDVVTIIHVGAVSSFITTTLLYWGGWQGVT
jgi:predicted GIY-YIG superfamily endonuclease